ncbi:hypothetical protein HYC85_011849 [Camellia sinensis]|uniref:Transmembrane protein n=1 Tax=Camellia sinensis TaxID=4442 RepID=A0A7J7HDG0_CAMSI|nr:hypothetical protein HYC85_011849 [Camellia sinensis]
MKQNRNNLNYDQLLSFNFDSLFHFPNEILTFLVQFLCTQQPIFLFFMINNNKSIFVFVFFFFFFFFFFFNSILLDGQDFTFTFFFFFFFFFLNSTLLGCQDFTFTISICNQILTFSSSLIFIFVLLRVLVIGISTP